MRRRATRARATLGRAAAGTVAVVMLLLVATSPASPAHPGSSMVAAASTGTLPARVAVADLHEVTYFPPAGGYALWDALDPAVVEGGMSRAAALGANTVRLLVQTADIGYPVPTPSRLAALTAVLGMAGEHGLTVHLTLFDGFTGFADLTGSRRWVQSVLAAATRAATLSIVELKNEIDTSSPAALSWASAMLPFLRSLSSGVPVTVSVNGWNTLAPLSALIRSLGPNAPDLWDYHFYGDPGLARALFAQAAAMTAGRPLIIGETGYPTLKSASQQPGVPWTVAAQEYYQEYVLRMVELAARDAGLPPAAPWMLNDMLTTACLCPAEQLTYGLFRLDGTPKPVVATIAAAFAGRPLDTTLPDPGFEADAGGFPAYWRLEANAYALTMGRDTSVHRDGVASARIGYTTQSPTGELPSFFAIPPIVPLSGLSYTLTAWVTGRGVTGTTRVSIWWYDATGRWISGADSGSLAAGDSSWRSLSVTSTTPAGAAYARLELTSCQNRGAVWFDDVSFGPIAPSHAV